MKTVLVLRLGALGDFVLSFPAFAALRAHHAADHLVLLTTTPFVPLAKASPWFDDIRVDTRPGWLNLPGLWRLRQQLRADLVYDLQTSRRSSRYFWLAGRPPWSGIAAGSIFPDANPGRNQLHTVDRQRGQLAAAGVNPAPLDLSWLTDYGPVLEERYALLIPGTSGSHGDAKTWPLPRFAELAGRLVARGFRPVVVGNSAEADKASAILKACPTALDFTGKTSILELAGLARRATLAIGGDTGPLHMAAMMGCPTIGLFSRFSDPVQATPVGRTTLLREIRLEDLTVDRVAAVLP